MSTNEIKQNEIIRIAREAGSIDSEDVILTVYTAFSANERNRLAWTQEHWTQYEHAIAAAERELCAKVCKDIANSQFESGETETAGVLDHCAAVIRARGE